MDLVRSEAVTELALPDGTLVGRSDLHDDGEDENVWRGSAHFNNSAHTASVYLSYSVDNSL